MIATPSISEGVVIKKQACIFLNGEYAEQEPGIARVHPDSLIIGVDGGSVHLPSYSLQPQVIIGDLDSLPAASLAMYETIGTQILQHSPHKDETDFELALAYAVEQGCGKILVFGALGGRTDQMLANILLPITYLGKYQIRLFYGNEELFYITNKAIVSGKAGDLISLLPVEQDAKGVLTTGLRYRLISETLTVGKSRGISNEMTGDKATISLSSGFLLCIHTSCDVNCD